MKSAERAALKSAIKRYTRAKKASKAIALASLIKEGTHTPEGKITTDYGGKASKKRASNGG